MLYDKRWEKPEIKADPFSLESFIAWLEKQPADKTYEWSNCDGDCLIGQYGAAMGYSWSEMIGDTSETCPYVRLTPKGLALASPRTFGGALERARKALAER